MRKGSFGFAEAIRECAGEVDNGDGEGGRELRSGAMMNGGSWRVNKVAI